MRLTPGERPRRSAKASDTGRMPPTLGERPSRTAIEWGDAVARHAQAWLPRSSSSLTARRNAATAASFTR